MIDRLALAREAMRCALQLRRSLSIAREDPVSVYGIADAVGVEVRFADLPSLEGMFLRDPHPVIILPALNHRPRGRITFSCAHELGHFQLGHGTRVDEYLSEGNQGEAKSDDEFAADTFASSLLMPRPAVLHRFRIRNWEPATASAMQLFAIAGELDVGYGTLIKHMTYGLELVGPSWLQQRKRTTPKQLRTQVLGERTGRRVLLADEFWPGVPLDFEVGEFLAVHQRLKVQASGLLSADGARGEWQLFVATRPGHARIELDGRPHSVRVARSGYCGQLKYRFLEDPDDPDAT